MSEVGPSCQVARSWQAVVRPGRAGPRSKSRRRIPHPPTGLARASCPLSAGEPPGTRATLGIGVDREGVLQGETLWWLEPEVPPGARGGGPATRGAHDVALAHEVGLGDRLDRVGLLPHGDGEGREP